MPSGGGRLPTEGSTVDVCVLGAGIAGLTTAYELAKRGFEVVVLEGASIAGGETRRTTAHLANALDDRFTTLERRHGTRGADLLVQAHGAAIDWIERFCRDHAVDCGFQRVPGYLFDSNESLDLSFEDELDASRRAGLRVDLVEDTDGLPALGRRALRYEDQAEIDAGEYLRALAEATIAAGVRICETSFVETVDDGKPSKVVLQGERSFRANHVVCATNAPIVGVASMSLRLAAYRSYVLAFEVPKGVVPRALYWDTDEPYHYVRLTESAEPANDLLLVGGEDHKVGQDDDPSARFAVLEDWTRKNFPEVKGVSYHWSGQIMEPFDGVGFVGRAPGAKGSSFLISGDSGNGMTLGTLGGVLVADLIEGKANDWAEVFDPERSITKAIGEFARENANTAKQYLDLVRGGDVEDANQIAPGHGAIVRDGLNLVAVFRDEDGLCHASSAICTHLDGVVRWNDAEGTWDCPCHGSRFDRYGQVIIGPATEPLGKVP